MQLLDKAPARENDVPAQAAAQVTAPTSEQPASETTPF
jgi:hypothetical protein